MMMIRSSKRLQLNSSELSQDDSETKEVKQFQAEKGADYDFQHLEMKIFPPMLNNNPQYNKLLVRP
jgi:hypothetical protein